MPANSFGQAFIVTTYGESHGPALGCIVDGCPAGLALSEDDIQCELDRRKPGQSRYVSQRREADQVKILSGVFQGQTTGTPIHLQIENHDQRSRDYDDLADVFRPGHADYTYYKKYGIRDHRGGGRASARETVARVAAGAIAKKYLQQHFNIKIQACLTQMGELGVNQYDWPFVSQNPFFCPDPSLLPLLEQKIIDLQREGNSIGAKILVEALNVPVGLGEPVFDKLDARLAYAMMGINAVKAVEIGSGFQAVTQKGNEHRDEMDATGFLTNHAGGILGGISTGQTIYASIAFKPTSSIRIPGKTIDIHGREREVSTTGRHDPCVGIRAVPIVEGMMALVLMDFALLNRIYEKRELPR